MTKISIFGGSSPRPGDREYEDALRLGKLVGLAGYTVLTGGYIGTMEAVSRGASESGGHVIGVTCDEIEDWRPVDSNAWVKEEWRHEKLHERLISLIGGCDAAIALPGGIGTLTEILLMWNMVSIHSIIPRPLILVGAGWEAIIQELYTTQADYIPESQKEFLQFARNVDQAFDCLKLSLKRMESIV